MNEIQAILAPVIGQGGVTALYERSLHLTSRLHPWLAALLEDGSGMDLEGLELLVAQQDDETAASGAGFLLQSFHDLLAGLVGSSLTRQLIGAGPSADPEADKAR